MFLGKKKNLAYSQPRSLSFNPETIFSVLSSVYNAFLLDTTFVSERRQLHPLVLWCLIFHYQLTAICIGTSCKFLSGEVILLGLPRLYLFSYNYQSQSHQEFRPLVWFSLKVTKVNMLFKSKYTFKYIQSIYTFKK